MTPQEPERDELESYLDGRSPLSRLYREVSREQPPPALDQRIRDAARQAKPVRSRSRLPFSPFSGDWMLPAALAAVVVVSVSLVLLTKEASTEFDRLPTGVPPQTAKDEQAAEPAATARTEELRAKATTGVRRQAPARGPAAGSLESQSREPQPYAAPAPVRTMPALAAPVPQATGATPQANVTRRGLAADALEKKARLRERAAPMSIGTAASKSLSEAAGEEAQGDAVQPAAPAAEPESPVLSPEAWLARIAGLRRIGRTAEADAELARFREHYPDYPVEAFLKTP